MLGLFLMFLNQAQCFQYLQLNLCAVFREHLTANDTRFHYLVNHKQLYIYVFKLCSYQFHWISIEK